MHPRVQIVDGPLRAEIVPHLGAGLSGLWLEGTSGLIPLMRPAPADVEWFNALACYTLTPWCNRIAMASLTFQGRVYPMRADWVDGTAIHGIGKDHPWHVLDRSPVSASFLFRSQDVGRPNWPWTFESRIRYEVEAGSADRHGARDASHALHVELTTRNTDSTPMPYSCGFHPFYPQMGNSRIRLTTAPLERYPAVEMIPYGPPARERLCERFEQGTLLDLEPIDDVFRFTGTGYAGGVSDAASRRVRIELPTGADIDVETSPEFGHFVVFSGRGPKGNELDFACIEPVSAANDGCNLENKGVKCGVMVLTPGEATTARWTLRVRARG
ncbi:MAG: hypothetical protein SFZ23_02640 [Planctomycetota bacterium]|nr:hypothetical protein [Planctomycetota bacterium]